MVGKELVDKNTGAVSNSWVELTCDARTELWMSILDQEGQHSNATLEYYTLLEKGIPTNVAEAIEKDLDRTFPDFDLFRTGNGQQSMRSILQAYAAYDPEVGYCQGMNFLVGLLIFYLPREDDAFGALVFLMHERGLRDLYTTNMELLEIRLWQLSRLMPTSLRSYLESFGVLPVLFASSWFLTCFASSFPIEIAARILDVVLCYDFRSFMLRFAYTLVKSNHEHIVSMESTEDILEFLSCCLPNRRLSELHDLVTEAFLSPWSEEQGHIVESSNISESVHDSVLRVEDALSSEEVPIQQEDCEVKRRKHHCFKRAFPKVARFLSQIVIINLKQLNFLCMSSPVQ
eukprot:g8138.t1